MDRFILMGCVDIKGNAGAQVKQLKASGFFGIKIYAFWGPYDCEDYFALYEAAEKAQLPILFHAGESMFKSVPSKNAHPHTLIAVAKKFSNLKIIAAHMAYPFERELVAGMRECPNLFSDISANGILGLKTVLAEIQAAPEIWSRIFFGSDHFHPLLYETPKYWAQLVADLKKLIPKETPLKQLCHDHFALNFL